MPVVVDPEGIAISILLNLAHFSAKRVLEIGCGDGRITMGYAGRTQHVTAIDPDAEDIGSAHKNKPAHLADRVSFIESSIEDFNQPLDSEKFDIILYTYSL